MPETEMRILTALDNNLFLSGSDKRSIYLYAELQGGTLSKPSNRIPLNISMVMDRSGSMSGEKLEFTKKALHFVIDQLGPEDLLSIIQYDHEVEILQPAGPVNDKAHLHQLVDQIRSRGWTNLSGGMFEGFNQVGKMKKEGFVNRVVLLSDGLANKGVTNPSALGSAVQKRFREEGIALSTIGVGADFNEGLMNNLAEYGGGNYYFINNPDELPDIFAEELHGLLSVVSQNATLTVDFSSQHLKCSKVYDHSHTIGQSQVKINFNDLHSKEEKASLIRFDLINPLEEPLAFNCTITWNDAQQDLAHVSLVNVLELSLTNDKELYEAAENKLVYENVGLFETDEMFMKTVSDVDKGDFDEKEIQKKIKAVLANLEKRSGGHHLKRRAKIQEMKTDVESYQEGLSGLKDIGKMELSIKQKEVKYDRQRKRRRKKVRPTNPGQS